MAFLDLLERQPSLFLHQVDQAEVARAEHDHVAAGHVFLGRFVLLAPRRLLDGEPDHRVLLVAAHVFLDLAARQRTLHEVVEAVAVALLEGRALRLPVVGEHDDLVGPACVPAGPFDAPELLVELAQRLHRVGPLEAGVMSDLVVAGERRVDRRPPAHHVGEHAEHDQIAHDHAHCRAHQRVDPAAMAARAHVPAGRADRRGPFQQDLPEEQHERPCDVEPVCVERAVAGVRLLLLLEAADGEDYFIRLAGEQVPAAGAAVHEQSDARSVAALDLGAVGGRGARDHAPGLLLHPPERGYVLVRPEQDPAWLAPVCEERSGSHSASR